MKGDNVVVAFSFICNKDWDSMPPTHNGRYCSQCDKTVVDFTQRTTIDVEAEIANAGGELCGRFKRSQTIYSKIAASMLVTAGIGLANANAQAPAVDDNTPLTITNKDIEEVKDSLPEVFFGVVAEQMPEYINGGEAGLMKFLAENIKYPQEGEVNGTVYVGFTIDTLGNTKDITILRTPSPIVNNEVIRVVGLLKFKPGMQMGKLVEVRYTLPIKFTLRTKHE